MVKINDVELTDDEARHLAMHAHYAAEGELDPRRYVVGVDESRAIKHGVDWATRHQRRERWDNVSRELWPGEIWPGGSR